MLWKQLFIALIAFFLLSGISSEFFSWYAAFDRGTTLLLATLSAVATGAVITPLLLPWTPFRQFWLKGAMLGGFGATMFLFFVNSSASLPEMIGLFLWITGCSSYLAMNFTGSTPFTSLSGVEKEMRRGLPFQMGTTLLAVILWLYSPFI